MKIGTITGVVTMKSRSQQLEGETVLLAELEGNDLAALDKAGAQVGDRVLILLGQDAGRYSMEAPADAVVVAVVE